MVFASGNSSDCLTVEVQFMLAGAGLIKLEDEGCSVPNTDSVIPANGCICHVFSDCERAVLLSAAPAIKLAIRSNHVWTSPSARNQVCNAAWYLHWLRRDADGLFTRLL